MTHRLVEKREAPLVPRGSRLRSFAEDVLAEPVRDGNEWLEQVARRFLR